MLRLLEAEDDRRLHRELAATPNNGGQFFFDEVTAKALALQLLRLLFDPPEQDRFTSRPRSPRLMRQCIAICG